MGSYPRCAHRSGRCGWGEGVVCAHVCLAEASVGLIALSYHAAYRAADRFLSYRVAYRAAVKAVHLLLAPW